MLSGLAFQSVWPIEDPLALFGKVYAYKLERSALVHQNLFRVFGFMTKTMEWITESSRYFPDSISNPKRKTFRQENEQPPCAAQERIKSWKILVEPMTEMVASQHRLKNWKQHSQGDAQGESTEKPSNKRGRLSRRRIATSRQSNEDFKLFTFVPDKRMAPNGGISSLGLGLGERPSLLEGSNADSSKRKTLRKGSFLTFHQLAFHCDTLKSYDTSVFVVKGQVPEDPDRLAPKQKGRKRIRSVILRQGNSRHLREAAEILLGLKSDVEPSSEGSFPGLPSPALE